MDLEHPAPITYHASFTEKQLKGALRQPYSTIQDGKKRCTEVIVDDGKKGVESSIRNNLLPFRAAASMMEYKDLELYVEFGRCQVGVSHASWKRTMDMDKWKDESKRTTEVFPEAWKDHMENLWRRKKMRDSQICGMHRGIISKPDDVEPNLFFPRWREIWESLLELPAGIQPRPTDQEEKAWYIMCYPKSHRIEFYVIKDI